MSHKFFDLTFTPSVKREQDVKRNDRDKLLDKGRGHLIRSKGE